MGRIVVCTNPCEPRECETHEHQGPFINWLAKRYPQGFHGPAVAAFNGVKLAPPEYDRHIGQHDTVALAILPTGAGVGLLIAKALLGAAISFALNWAINQLFGTKSQPQSFKSANTVYAIGVPANTNPLGQPIHVQYGRNWIVPPVASAPYRWFQLGAGHGYYGNAYAAVILSLGYGLFDIHDIKIGQTSVTAYGTDVVGWWYLPPSVHLGYFGQIKVTTGIEENVFTSEEVTDLELQPSGSFNMGPYVASPRCTSGTELQYDIELPQGGYRRTDKGGAQFVIVNLEFQAEQIDNDGTPTGYTDTKTYSELFWDATPFRRTITHTLPAGRYRVYPRRVPAATDGPQDNTKVYFTGLKAVLGAYCGNTSVYAGTTLLAVLIRATQGVSGSAHNRISVDCTRYLEGTATRSHTKAFRDILTNQTYGGRRPAEEVDETSLTQVDSEVGDCTFDHIFDGGGTVWDALRASVQMIRGIPVANGAVLGILRDKPHNVPVAAFNEDNMLSFSRTMIWDEPGDYDGIQGEYTSADDGSKLTAVYPYNATNPERIVLYGCRSEARALCYLEQIWKQKTLRRRINRFETELDGATVSVGSPINITHSRLGASPVLHVISKIEHAADDRYRIEAFVYEPGVFA